MTALTQSSTRPLNIFGSLTLLAALLALPACREDGDNNSTQIVLAAAPRLSFSIEPSSVQIGQSFDIELLLLDSQGQINKGDSSTQLTLSLANDPSNGVVQITGPSVVTVNQGRALFSSLSFDTLGQGYRLEVSSSGSHAAIISQPFNMTPPLPRSLSFVTQPALSLLGANDLSLSVEVRDRFGQRDLTDNSSVISLNLGQDPSGQATLGPTRSLTVSQGLAVFTGLNVSEAGRGFTVVASTPGLSVTESQAFTVRTRPFNDFNGDGFADVIVGGVCSDGQEMDSGAAFMFFGSANPTGSLTANQADIIFQGQVSGDAFGSSVEFVGDVNGDGFADVLVGAPFTGDGKAYIYYGSATPASSFTVADADVRIDPEFTAEDFGCFVTSLGDLNNDDFDDFVVAAPLSSFGGLNSGLVYVFYGQANLPAVLNAMDADLRIAGRSDDEYFGESVVIGDFNGDGQQDLAIGASGTNAPTFDEGAVYVFLDARNLAATIDTGAADIVFTGSDTNDNFGSSLALTDVNGDGRDDLVIGAILDELTGSFSGAAYIFYGLSSPPTAATANQADVVISGLMANAFIGTAACRLGDVNDDGFEDFMLTARGADFGNGQGAVGAAFLFYGSNSLPNQLDLSLAEAVFVGETGSRFGDACRNAGDFNGDGFSDIIIGGAGFEAASLRTGAAFLYLGSLNRTGQVSISDAALSIYGEAADDGFGIRVGGQP